MDVYEWGQSRTSIERDVHSFLTKWNKNCSFFPPERKNLCLSMKSLKVMWPFSWNCSVQDLWCYFCVREWEWAQWVRFRWGTHVGEGYLHTLGSQLVVPALKLFGLEDSLLSHHFHTTQRNRQKKTVKQLKSHHSKSHLRYTNHV